MSFMWTVAMLIIALVVVRISHWLFRWSNPKCNGKLPPGSMGFPIIGESMDFCKPHRFDEISPFLKKRMLKYGPLFRTNIFGSQTIVSTDSDVNFEILRQENKSFILSYPEVLVKRLGKDSLVSKDGNIHKHMKNFTHQHLLGSEGLKQKMIRDMDRVTREHLESKADSGILDVRDSVASLVVALMAPKMISSLKPETQTKFMEDIKAFNFDWFQLSFTLSGWKFLYIAFRAHRNGTKLIKDVLTKRKIVGEKYGDFLDTMLEELEKEGCFWNQDSAANHIFFMSFAAQETTPKATCLAVKFLSENPKVVAELKREHEAILESREDKESGITWEEYRQKMSFTNMVINETLRLINFVPFLFRKAVTDVEIKGYTIPAGWIVFVAAQVVHYDPKTYENPFEFNPWRWERQDLRSGSKMFMGFGGGVRQCVGAEFARLQMAIFLHYLVTTYDFSMAEDCAVLRKPGLLFHKDLSINISRLK
ncbi:PREDICTED: cytochrome P450 708A2-like [Camelina sativa]|uniref:Cytochrome P450 708A2-like n=1 Tax=Camelina sativa TaxID=90675 RepID=A0ABM0WJQ6_CAMSA|nr:PREDICTED: cytochrome P450 708A2-like [Camelina sativa]